MQGSVLANGNLSIRNNISVLGKITVRHINSCNRKELIMAEGCMGQEDILRRAYDPGKNGETL